MEPRQSMVGNQRKHMVFHVIVHVPVQIPMNRVQIDCSAIETVVEDILRQARVLGKPIEHHEPCAEQIGESDEQQRKNAAGVNSHTDDGCIYGYIYTRPSADLWEFCLGNIRSLFCEHPSRGVQEDMAEVFWIHGHIKEGHED